MRDKITKFKRKTRIRRHWHIRNHVFGSPERPRLVVYRSLKHIYAQIIDDSAGKTLVSCSDIANGVELKPGKKTEVSFQVGLELGKKAKAAGITRVCFDRAGFLYHGRVKALADGARKAGLEF